MGAISVYKVLMSYRWQVWFNWKKRDLYLRAKGSRNKKIPFNYFLNMENLVLFLVLFFFIFKGNHHGMAAWRLARLSSLGPCCLRQLSCIHFCIFCCIYVNGFFKEKECFYIFTVFLWKAFHNFIIVSLKLGRFMSHHHTVFSFSALPTLSLVAISVGVNVTVFSHKGELVGYYQMLCLNRHQKTPTQKSCQSLFISIQSWGQWPNQLKGSSFS